MLLEKAAYFKRMANLFLPLSCQYPEITYIVFVTFLALMSILIMNLLVGLAVDDIKAVQDQAILKRLAMQTQVHSGLMEGDGVMSVSKVLFFCWF